jgi:hypothetical protein
LAVAAAVLCCACGSSAPAAASNGGASAGSTASMGASGSSSLIRAGRGGSAGVFGAASGTSAGRSGATGVSGVAGRAAAGSGMVSAGVGSSVSSATFAQVYTIISNRCAGVTCHVSATTSTGGGLSMSDRATAYRNLVGANAGSCRGEKRVVASNPDKSELMHSLTHTKLGSCSPPQMPLALPVLPQTELDTVDAWIRGGAPNN